MMLPAQSEVEVGLWLDQGGWRAMKIPSLHPLTSTTEQEQTTGLLPGQRRRRQKHQATKRWQKPPRKTGLNHSPQAKQHGTHRLAPQHPM